MTGREFSEVDIDLLADYVGGALDGTPDEAVVAALIADDPDWRTAHESLTAGMVAAGAQLRALGADPTPMPDDVVSRLTAALTAGLADHPVAAPAGAEPDGAELVGAGPAGAGQPASGRRLSVVPGSGSSAAPRPATARPAGAPRRGLPRWVRPVAVAAGVLAFAGLGVDRFWGVAKNDNTSDGAASNADLAPEANTPMMASGAPAQGLVAAPPPERVASSGIDYDATTLTAMARLNTRAAAPPAEQRESADRDGKAESAAARGLERLADRNALLDCLQAIAQEWGAGDITVDTVDYARFAGAPALIVRFTAADGSWAWAAGPDCGAPGSGADTRYRVKVG